MSAVRLSFQDELEIAEQGLLAEGRLVQRQLGRVMTALEERNVDVAQSVIEDDDLIDDIYLATDSRILNLIALQAPVAGDLRLVSAMLHSNVHIERMGDLCVNIAKFILNGHTYPTNDAGTLTLQEMGARAAEMVHLALAAFSARSLAMAEELPIKDDVIDRLNRGMLVQLGSQLADERGLEWAINLLLVARYLERIGDHAVDIGEQTAFLVTGVFREFTDASR